MIDRGYPVNKQKTRGSLHWLKRLVRERPSLEERYSNNVWPDVQREYPDPKRPGLVYVVPPEHVFLCPYEVDRLSKEWDEKHEPPNPKHRQESIKEKY